MDRSFLSQPEVIEASRQFVCVRLTTYEDQAEMDFMKSIGHTRSGEVENSMFTVLGPDGQEPVVRADRSMRRAYRDAKEMAAGMAKLIGEYKPKATPASLPVIRDVRLALDVAAADGQPLVVLSKSIET